MEKIDRLRLLGYDSLSVLNGLKEAISIKDEEKTVEMLEELLDRGALIGGIIDHIFVKIESGRLKVDSRMTRIIANTILKKTTQILLGSSSSVLYRHMYDIREFAEIIGNSETSEEVIDWYGTRFKTTGVFSLQFQSDR